MPSYKTASIATYDVYIKYVLEHLNTLTNLYDGAQTACGFGEKFS